MKKNFLYITLMSILPLGVIAQDFTDALRYSSLKLEGTARSGGMGNAFGALGGDFTAAGINPAGLGLYRSAEFAFTPTFGMTESKSLYLGNQMTDNSYKLGVNNLSYVAAILTKDANSSGLVSVNIGIGYNKVKDFNSYSIAEGYNATSSFMDYVTDNANRNDWSDFYEELAWKTDVLLYDTDAKEYWHDTRDAGYGQSQRKSFDRTGSLNEYTLGMGLNFGHKLYLGASFGITDLYYKEYATLSEWDENNDIPFLNDYQFNTSLRTIGTGYSFKAGVIFKPFNQLRLGASIATPTFYNLHDNFETSMQSSITYEDNSSEKYKEDSPTLEYDYDLVTPFKATLSGAYVVGKKGLISADIEVIDYSIAKLRNGGDGEQFIDQNKDINDIYKPVTNFRLGGEYRLTDNFSLRAGYELYPSAFNDKAFGVSQPNAGQDYTVYAAGFGYKSGNFFVDLAYRYSKYTDYTTFYPTPVSTVYPEPKMAKFDNTGSKVLFTLGFRF